MQQKKKYWLFVVVTLSLLYFTLNISKENNQDKPNDVRTLKSNVIVPPLKYN